MIKDKMIKMTLLLSALSSCAIGSCFAMEGEGMEIQEQDVNLKRAASLANKHITLAIM
ncbi:MAG: hypothetical protein ACOH2E_05655 [Candidatus Paracaedibacter sp.]